MTLTKEFIEKLQKFLDVRFINTSKLQPARYKMRQLSSVFDIEGHHIQVGCAIVGGEYIRIAVVTPINTLDAKSVTLAF